jgi:hypothetical protein
MIKPGVKSDTKLAFKYEDHDHDRQERMQREKLLCLAKLLDASFQLYVNLRERRLSSARIVVRDHDNHER